eukprot:6180711-Pleurochrysis_carterae.AAC.2
MRVGADGDVERRRGRLLALVDEGLDAALKACGLETSVESNAEGVRAVARGLQWLEAIVKQRRQKRCCSERGAVVRGEQRSALTSVSIDRDNDPTRLAGRLVAWHRLDRHPPLRDWAGRRGREAAGSQQPLNRVPRE